MNHDLNRFFIVKRKEFEFAKQINSPILQKVILNGIKQVAKYHNLKQPKAVQLELF